MANVIALIQLELRTLAYTSRLHLLFMTFLLDSTKENQKYIYLEKYKKKSSSHYTRFHVKSSEHSKRLRVFQTQQKPNREFSSNGKNHFKMEDFSGLSIMRSFFTEPMCSKSFPDEDWFSRVRGDVSKATRVQSRKGVKARVPLVGIEPVSPVKLFESCQMKKICFFRGHHHARRKEDWPVPTGGDGGTHDSGNFQEASWCDTSKAKGENKINPIRHQCWIEQVESCYALCLILPGVQASRWVK